MKNSSAFTTSTIASIVVFISAAAGYAAPAWACSSCGCTLSSDWESQGFSSQTGWRLDLRYDYLNQNQLRSGTGTISPAAASRIVNGSDPQEVEKFTTNRYVTATIDYSASSVWGVSLQVPYIDRKHSTLGTASDGVTPGPGGEQYESDNGDLGDIKVIGRYQGFTPQHQFGVLFGLKLPTGSHRKTGTSTDPAEPGSATIDPGLQPGTGSTDAILGAYYFDALNKDWGYFAQAVFQSAIDTRNGYRPGNGMNANLGLRYLGFDSATPQIQLNARRVIHDSGSLADTTSTGGTLLYLSPGVTVPLSKQTALYGFVQLPVYQKVNGVQLTPKFTASAGVHFSF